MKKARKISPITYSTAKEYKATQYDPIMLQINLILKNSKLSLPEIAARCGVTIQTMYNWRAQRTKRPQGITMKFVLRALGYDLRIMPSIGHNRGGIDDDAA